MKFLCKTVETYRVGTEDEAKALIEEAKKDRAFTLVKYSSEYRCSKTKGEISDEWYRVTLQKEFNVEKEPDTTVEVEYHAYEGVFPSAIKRDVEEEPVEADDDEGVVIF